ncbi:J domain-containing protein [Natrarchaeobius halalkaliphilus]|uniref:J domain-containing protein n=1 Tax=Natrarchaeobius halalkaliphilus TaxID=1679091 RepID=A0A3N6M449_9EURY|nr:J domain-containing protein [Natrarchaeobius halalkaliphilus]RQG90001.1 J domain-containing protein [Natrarchaeobius halalkaliphilus]
MTVTEKNRAGCDGCGRTVPLEKLSTVTMPNGDAVACCPHCEPHARRAAESVSTLDQRRNSCDGCESVFLESELEEIPLADGTVVSCCRSCAKTSSDGNATATAEDDANRSGDDGRTDDRGQGEIVEEPTDELGDEQSYRCTQCTELIEVEPFRITTVDGRTERFCPSCKERAKADGIIASVAMRKTKARDVLGVEKGASPDEIQTAYRGQVKRAHPDRPTGSLSAFELVTDAYERLRRDGY